MTRNQFRQIWLDALRSGKYQKTEGTYINNEGCCCTMGLAARLLVPEGSREEVIEDGLTTLWLLFPEISPLKNQSHNSLWNQITNKNDAAPIAFGEARISFSEMADFLEGVLPVD